MQGTVTILKAKFERIEHNFIDKLPTLEQLQSYVEGYIELVPMFDTFEERPAVAFCNEKGKLQGKPYNELATLTWHSQNIYKMSDILVGDVVILRGDDEWLTQL